MQPVLELKSLSKIFYSPRWEKEVFKDIDLTVFEGEFICFLGPSGCGKTTLLRIIAGLELYTSGDVVLRGRLKERPSSECAIVFQEPRLFPWLTVAENIAFGLKGQLSAHERTSIVQTNLERIGLSGCAPLYPHELSGGMAQRVAIARALAIEPSLLLLDEPFSALDAITRQRLQEEMLQLWRTSGKTMIMVTHDIEEALKLGRRILVFSSSPGRILREFSSIEFGQNADDEREKRSIKQEIMKLLSV